jgi:hypothetical protein
MVAMTEIKRETNGSSSQSSKSLPSSTSCINLKKASWAITSSLLEGGISQTKTMKEGNNRLRPRLCTKALILSRNRPKARRRDQHHPHGILRLARSSR